jgi:hypothetical protein
MTFWLKNLLGKEKLTDLNMDGGIIGVTKWTLGKYIVVIYTELTL